MDKLKKYPELLKTLPSDDVLTQCMHCGMCLATCPTYDLTKLERSSPRGRIRMIKSIAEGELEISDSFINEMNFCLDCQACETACPAGVKYGSMVESARDLITKAKLGSKLGRIVKTFSLNKIVASNRNLKIVAKILYFYQNSGFEWVVNKICESIPFLNKLGELNKLTPRISKKFSDSIIKEKEIPEGNPKFKIAFSTGCIMNVAFADINIDTVEVLLKNGCEIITPKEQFCCGSLHAHNGEMDKANELAKKNLDVFSKIEYDYLISNSAGCGAFMKEYAHIFQGNPEYAEKAKKFSSKVKDITEFLSEHGLNKDEIASLNKHVTYHDACHLAHTQKITKQPRDVIAELPGLKITSLEESTWCCGSAGIYNVVRYDDALKFLQRKMKNIKNTQAEIVLTGNPGCMGQIQYGTKKFDVDVEVIHPVTLINRMYKNQKSKNEDTD